VSDAAWRLTDVAHIVGKMISRNKRIQAAVMNDGRTVAVGIPFLSRSVWVRRGAYRMNIERVDEAMAWVQAPAEKNEMRCFE